MVITWDKSRIPKGITLFNWFIIYSYIGWLYETIYCTLDLGRYVDRGFLYGPVCPIYGVCIVLYILLFEGRFKNNIMLFLSCALFASSIEYITSVWMELVFHKRWWNYYNQPFNLEGRVCLGAAIVFGLSGVFIIRFLHPRLVSYMDENFDMGTIKKASKVILFIFLLDLLVTIQTNL